MPKEYVNPPGVPAAASAPKQAPTRYFASPSGKIVGGQRKGRVDRDVHFAQTLNADRAHPDPPMRGDPTHGRLSSAGHAGRKNI